MPPRFCGGGPFKKDPFLDTLSPHFRGVDFLAKKIARKNFFCCFFSKKKIDRKRRKLCFLCSVRKGRALKLIEQTTKKGIYYVSSIKLENGKKRLVSEIADLSSLILGKGIKAQIWKDKTSIWLVASGKTALFKLNHFVRFSKPSLSAQKTDELFLSLGKYKDESTLVWSKDQVKEDPNFKVDWQKLTLPISIAGFVYDESFSYSKELTQILGKGKAAFIDSIKRPLSVPSLLNHGTYYPKSLDKSSFSFKDLAKYGLNLPIAVDMGSLENLACLDLEPHFTQEDLDLANSFDAYYVEETPRGGRHYLIKAKGDAYKYRLTKNLEAQINASVTWYGLFGKWLKDNAQESDLSKYKIVGKRKEDLKINECPPRAQSLFETIKTFGDIDKIVLNKIKWIYETDDDPSHADWMAILTIYNRLKPNFTTEDMDTRGWVLELFARNLIPYRPKHDTDRCGVSYLTYLCFSVVTWIKENS